MLGMSKYPKDYIAATRARVKADLAAYRKVVKAAKGGGPVASFEPVFFNNMVIALDAAFVHRLRTQEGKDGNPLNEVRVIVNSILVNQGIMLADKQIKMNPAKSVLKYEVGDEISVNEAGFSRLADAFFAEIESKFS